MNLQSTQTTLDTMKLISYDQETTPGLQDFTLKLARSVMSERISCILLQKKLKEGKTSEGLSGCSSMTRNQATSP